MRDARLIIILLYLSEELFFNFNTHKFFNIKDISYIIKPLDLKIKQIKILYLSDRL